ncbi:MAG TPA: hypothetical protein VIP57_02000 [Candidatus Dormibacteraeota bacterium]
MRIAVTLGICMLLSACGPTGAVSSSSPAAGAGTQQQPASAPRITPPPVSPPQPPAGVAAFQCANASGGVAGTANLTSVRLAEPGGFDRFVLQFDTKVPSYALKRQAKPVFKSGGSGQAITLSGTSGVLVQIHSATASGSYTGAVDMVHADNSVLVEARIVEDFEGYLSWGLGLTKPACLRAFTLSDPPRLVIDFKTP